MTEPDHEEADAFFEAVATVLDRCVDDGGKKLPDDTKLDLTVGDIWPLMASVHKATLDMVEAERLPGETDQELFNRMRRMEGGGES